jgi:uncharacterized protein (DUF1778 family)
MGEKTESLLVRMSPEVKKTLLKAAAADHRPLANFMVHASIIYAKGILADENLDFTAEEESSED